MTTIATDGRSMAADGQSIDPPFAIGSGMDFALGAMDAGKSPAEAVEIACRRDPHSGGEVTSLSIGNENAADLAERFKSDLKAVA
jgi:ATP-dependent protease HslVU (ClpYQ) peptidase subunit